MPHISTMKTSKYLKKEDVGEDGTTVTIVNVHEANVAMEGKPAEMKWCMAFREFDKPMILNSTNAQLTAKFLGSEETEDWVGKQVVLYDDPTVSYGGELVGGIRVRRAGKAPARRPSPVRQAPPADDGDESWPEE
jgi:hypothetical protein